MSTIYFTASSVDGYIVDDRDSLDWLLSRNIDADGPFGYRAFSESVGALVMGATTYEWMVANEPGEWPYKQPTWVLTHRPNIVRPGDPVRTYHGDVTELQPQLLQAAGYQDVWVVGGGDAAAQFARAGSDRRNDRQLRTVHAGDGRAAVAPPHGVDAGGVRCQRRLRLRPLAEGLAAARSAGRIDGRIPLT